MKYGDETPVYELAELPTRDGFHLDPDNLWTPAIEATVGENRVYILNWIPAEYVAQVGETKYETLQEAFNAAQGGGTVTVLKDIVLDDQVEMTSGTVTLDMAGYTISNTSDIWEKTGKSDWSLISVQGGSLTVTGNGTFDAKENDCYAFDVRGGSLIFESGTVAGNIHALYVHHGELTVHGGTFSVKQVYSASQPYQFTLNCLDANYANGTAKITVDGGTFYKFNPEACEAEGVGTDFVAETHKAVADGDYYTVVPKENVTVTFDSDGGSEVAAQTFIEGGKAEKPADPTKDGAFFKGWFLGDAEYDFETVVNENITLTAKWADAVAKIGDTLYESLAAAEEASSDGNTIVLLKDVELAARVEIHKSVIIDLDGHTVTPTAACGNQSAFDVKAGTVTIRNGIIDGVSKTDANAECDPITVRSGAEVTLEGLTVDINSKTGACAYPFEGGKLNIVSGTYINSTNEAYPYAEGFDGMSLNQANVDEQLISVSGGTFGKTDPAKGDDSGKAKTFLADGYKSVDNGDGTYTVVPDDSVAPLTNITDEAYIVAKNGVTLDLNGYEVTGAKLFYVSGTLVDHGETRGKFSSEAYYLGQSVNSEFPIYDSSTGTYSLYDLGIQQGVLGGTQYVYKLSNTADRAEAGALVHNASDNGRFAAIVDIYWAQEDANIQKSVQYTAEQINKYTADVAKLALKMTFTGLDSVDGSVTAIPKFVVYDANGAIMMTLSGEQWTLK